ncbi:1,4-dihydroxy-2-naphthoate octaprenyltransferase [Olleya sp. YSTF-M6]|uniref:1,4-dihydroxy-2-naphthoate octaprenyltransferase n=1 Tax=Olleya sediminilitoris TaxID=2795739 RepID=A0ABS1WI64_9FLAO|nr:1,4-dihydroxy-2-naphthoate octaprenyltransferase [Olleya sediminilitoris]MBL7558811.1 1,4-dihydroxy-2-naphthoate octaprenyltransferase [Olleya sediminilitoris]
MNNTKKWLSAMRLRTLPLSISGIILGSCLAKLNGFFDITIFVFAILTTLSFQILSNLANDYGDGVKGTDNDDRIGPTRALQSGAITQKQMYNAIRFNVIVSIILTIILIYVSFGADSVLLGILFLIIAGFSIYAAIKYTVGDNAYGYKGKGDIFVFVFFGLISVIGSYMLYAKHVDVITLLPAISIGLLSTAVLNLNNMRDIVSDKTSNKITLAVKLGAVKAKQYHYVLIITAIILTVVFGLIYYKTPFNLIYFIAYLPLLLHLKKVNAVTNLKDFDPELKKLALTTVLLSILIGIGQLL